MIKQHNEREKIKKERPESAQNLRKVRPPSARRARPQSAKESYNRVPMSPAIVDAYGIQDDVVLKKPPISGIHYGTPGVNWPQTSLRYLLPLHE